MNGKTEKIIAVKLGERSYSIHIGSEPGDFFHAVRGKKVLLTADSHTEKLFGAAMLRQLKEAGAETAMAVFEAGEQSKNLGTVEKICREAVRAGLDRSSVFVALGGGVCGDMTGLAASLYMRGTRYYQVPTTLLAMVDSSVGGKTGVDLPEGKNLIGTFFQPAGVWINPENLRSLPEKQLSNGFAEMVKTAMILDGDLFEKLESEADNLFTLADHAPLEETIARCCELKAEVVSGDEKETGRRAILNYGHTFGHALESTTGYRTFEHGEAVAIGMCMASDLAVAMELISEEEAQRQEALLQAFHLPVTAEGLELSPENLLRAMHHDKKCAGGRIRVVLPDRIGHAAIFEDVDPSLLQEALCGRI